MLDPKTNRLDYGTLLMPPAGYALTHAVATTYSLDLYTLLAIPVALFYAKVMDGRFEGTRFDVLEAIQKSAEVLDVYCQKGKIKVPDRFNWLFAYIEKSIHEVTPSNYLASFHPKVWLLRFQRGSDVRYRLMVLSRNLTFDRSWDLAFHVDGNLTQRRMAANQPLVDFVRYLNQAQRSAGAKKILAELDRVLFEPVEGFKHLAFHPIGIDGYQHYTNPLDDRALDKLLIVSPFVDRTILKKLHRNCPGKKVLLSRQEELQKIPPAQFEGYIPYFLSPRIVDGEASEEMDETDFMPQRQQLHAKLFIAKHQGQYSWWLGSANCTDPAFTRNIEFMVGLEAENERLGPDAMADELVDPDDAAALFEPYEPVEAPPDDEAERIRPLLRKLVYDLANAHYVGKLTPKERAQHFDLIVSVDTRHMSWGNEFGVTLSPLNRVKDHAAIQPNTVNTLPFEDVLEVDLSVFVAVRIDHKQETVASFLVKMQIDLPVTREDTIFKRLIASRENFMGYLNFLLSDNPYLGNTILESPEDPVSVNGHAIRNCFQQLPIFEHLLITASRQPKRLLAVDRLIQRLMDGNTAGEDDIVPNTFVEFWQVFKQVAGIK